MERYKNRIKVVNTDMLCFPVDPITLEAVGVSTYDPYAYRVPEPDAIETVSINEWQRRRDANFNKR